MAEKIFDDVDEVRRLFTEANDLEAKGENVMAAERWAELASVVDYIPDQQIFYSRAACLSYIGKDYPGALAYSLKGLELMLDEYPGRQSLQNVHDMAKIHVRAFGRDLTDEEYMQFDEITERSGYKGPDN